MNSVKQLFLILSILSLASAKKGASLRNTDELVDNRRGLKKSSKKSSSKGGGSGSGFGGGFVAPNRGGAAGGIVGGSVAGSNGVNRDGTPVGALIQPAGKSCIPFDEARKWLTADYPGDIQCRVQTGQMQTATACCRVFSFTDTNGPQKWLLYDTNNQYRDLMCVCNENTGNAGSGTPAINVPGTPAINVPGAPAPTALAPTADRTGGIGGSPITTPTPPALPPAAAPALSTGPAGVCDNPNPTQLSLQDSPYMVPCRDSSPCGDNKCCFSNYCVCWPVSQLVPGTSYCL